MSLKSIFKYFLSWRLLVFLIAVLAMFVIKTNINFNDLTAQPSSANLLKMWSNFDGIHYQELAEFNYGNTAKTGSTYAFFPVFPWLIRQLNLLVGNFTVSGLLISNTAFILALFFLYKLVRLDFTEKISRQTIFLILIFPVSFFFGSVYNESLFLLLAVLSFYYARKNNFALACIFATIATTTRITGIFVWVALIIEYWQIHGKVMRSFIKPKILWLALPPMGLISYMYYQFRMTGDAFYFITYQSYVSGRSTSKFILLYQVFYRYIKMLITVNPLSTIYFTLALEFLVGLLFLFLLIISIKKLRLSYWVFCILSFILPTLTGTLSSIPRYSLVLFPVFAFLAYWLDKQHPFIRYIYCVLSIILSVLCISLFTRGYFIG